MCAVGIALLYLQLHRVSSETCHLQRSLDYVKRTLRNLNGRRVTFLCGDAGPLAVGAVVHHRLNNQVDSKECIAKYDTCFLFPFAHFSRSCFTPPVTELISQYKMIQTGLALSLPSAFKVEK